jgi:predicted nucleic acid-binding protein
MKPDAVLLDTDVFSFLGTENHKIGKLYRKHIRNKRVAISFVTVGEVLAGAKKANWPAARMATLTTRLRGVVVVPFDLRVCEKYAELVLLKTPDGTDRVLQANDRWIAACALTHGLPLVTHNRRHFDDIPGLTVITETPPLGSARVVALPLAPE